MRDSPTRPGQQKRVGNPKSKTAECLPDPQEREPGRVAFAGPPALLRRRTLTAAMTVARAGEFLVCWLISSSIHFRSALEQFWLRASGVERSSARERKAGRRERPGGRGEGERASAHAGRARRRRVRGACWGVLP